MLTLRLRRSARRRRGNVAVDSPPLHKGRYPARHDEHEPVLAPSFESAALQLYLAFRRAGTHDAQHDFEALCRAHPEHEHALRALRALDSAQDAATYIVPRPEEAPKGALEGANEQLPDAPDDRPALKLDAAAHSELHAVLRAAGPRGARYQLLGEVGRGGMGAILRVWDGELRRTLAMKVALGDEGHEIAPKVLGRFLEEAQITAQLDHPGVVPVHELGLDADGRVYFTMKLVRGEDLESVFEKVKSGRDGWSEVRALTVLLRVCEAVAYAHAKKVLHRDLKPANVMVGKFGEVYVMDWGLARVAGHDDGRDLRIRPQQRAPFSTVTTERRAQRENAPDSPLVTMDGDVVGTPSYMAPEQARGELDKLGPHSDVFSIGAMLYQLVTGRAPYAPDDAPVSPYALLMRVREGAPRPAHELAPRATGELIAIVEKAMARSIQARYPDTLALAEDLRAYVEGRVVRAYETGAWAQARKWVRRNQPLAAAVAAAALALVGGSVFSFRFARDAESARLAAVASATAAQLARDEATQRANDVLALSAQKDHDDLVAEAAELWPAHPELIGRYENWLQRAHELIDGRPADEARGLRKSPSLAEHRAKLAELRRDAKPQSESEQRAEREAHPKFALLQSKRAELLWMSRMLELEPWPSAEDLARAPEQEQLPRDANALNSLAWTLVDPAAPAFGEEVRALQVARRALSAASDENRAAVRDTLAWALLRTGRFDEALAEERAALLEPGGAALEGSAAKLKAAVAQWRAEGGAKLRAERERLSAECAALAHAVEERKSYEFADPQSEWWNRQLAKLVSDLEALRDPATGLMNDVRSEPFGWGVAKRLSFARSIEERSVTGPQARALWAEAIESIAASPKYGGLAIEPQMGLLPLGADPHSQLWEFAHLQTGEPARRAADGALALSEETGLVFVLIPGGRFWMGAQNLDPDARNFDPQAGADERPVREVELSAYFLSKYEMTQGQWLRVAASNPSFYQAPNELAPTLMHPVEQVSWSMCSELMARLSLTLPSEAQWEHGARGGTSSAWWTGQERETLRGRVNLADQSAKRAGATWSDVGDWPDLDDGCVVYCAVGSYAANPFGLHEVAGNVWEWCLDGYEADFYARRAARDPVAQGPEVSSRVFRGGSFIDAASSARSALRSNYSPEFRDSPLGVRPARELARSISTTSSPR